MLTKPNETALLMSPTFPGTTTGPGCLRFWYNMHGSTIGHLAVYMVETATQKGNRLWEVDGDHGDKWFPAALSLFYGKPFVVSSSACSFFFFFLLLLLLILEVDGAVYMVGTATLNGIRLWEMAGDHGDEWGCFSSVLQ